MSNIIVTVYTDDEKHILRCRKYINSKITYRHFFKNGLKFTGFSWDKYETTYYPPSKILKVVYSADEEEMLIEKKEV